MAMTSRALQSESMSLEFGVRRDRLILFTRIDAETPGTRVVLQREQRDLFNEGSL